MEALIFSDTPWECYEVYDNGDVWPVWVKRDGLCCEPPGPPYSKLRGAELYLSTLPEGTVVGIQDSGHHSRLGWGTAYICQRYGLECHVFYPIYKNPADHPAWEFQAEAEALGACLHGIKAGRASVIWHQARKVIVDISDGEGVMLPVGFRLREIAAGTAMEARDYTPKGLRSGTWIFSISSGTTAAGAIMGLEKCQEDIRFICYFGDSKNETRTRKWMIEVAGYEPDNLEYVDEGWAYTDAEDRPVPFPSSRWYEAKAWHWMVDNIEGLRQPVVFWNVGD